MANINGYEMQTTFWEDFSIADRFGAEAIADTFSRAFGEWKDDIVYLAELAMVTNWKCWNFYNDGQEEISRMYADYYHQCMDYAYGGGEFTEEEQRKFFELTD